MCLEARSPARVAQIIVIEAVVVAALAWLLASVVALPLSKLIGDALLGTMFSTTSDLPVQIEPNGLMLWLVVSLLGGVLSSLWPAMRASRASVHEALTYE